MMPLSDALHAVALQLGLDPTLLILYAEEDTLPGYYDSTGDQWSIPFAADGKFLYALIRALKPRHVLEIGTAYGGSARHILEALDRNGWRDYGMVCVDINPDARLDGIPDKLKPHVRIYHENSDYWIEREMADQYRYQFDFIHEDGAHSIHNVQTVYNYLPNLMPKGGVIVSHDIATGVGNDIRLGMRKVGYENVPEYVYEGSPCGFSVLKYKGVENATE